MLHDNHILYLGALLRDGPLRWWPGLALTKEQRQLDENKIR